MEVHIVENPCTIDLETTMRNAGEGAVGRMKSSPFFRDKLIP